MSEHKITEQINNILEGAGKLDSFALKAGKPEIFSSIESLLSRLAQLEMLDGWIQYTGEVIDIRTPGPVPQGQGTPLCGEFRIGEGKSVHLRQLEDGWLLLSIEREADKGLGYRQSFVMDQEPKSRLIYEIDYTAQENVFGEKVLREHLFRFAGFEKLSNGEV